MYQKENGSWAHSASSKLLSLFNCHKCKVLKRIGRRKPKWRKQNNIEFGHTLSTALIISSKSKAISTKKQNKEDREKKKMEVGQTQTSIKRIGTLRMINTWCDYYDYIADRAWLGWFLLNFQIVSIFRIY